MACHTLNMNKCNISEKLWYKRNQTFPDVQILKNNDCLELKEGHTVPGVCIGGVKSIPDGKTPGKQRGSGWRNQE